VWQLGGALKLGKRHDRETKVGTGGRRGGPTVLRVVHTIWAFVKSWEAGLRVGRDTRFGRL